MNGPNDADCGCEDCQDKGGQGPRMAQAGGMRSGESPRMAQAKRMLAMARSIGDTSKEEQIRRLIAEAKGRM